MAVDLLDPKNWYHLDVGQCVGCFEKNALKEVRDYVLRIQMLSYTVAVGEICIHCNQVHFEGMHDVLLRMGDRAVLTTRRQSSRDVQAIQARWTKRQLNRALRQINSKATSAPSKI